MNDLTRRIWEKVMGEQKLKNISNPKIKSRLRHELKIIEITHNEEHILSFIEQGKKAREQGAFYVKGAANCSLLLYYAGATTVNPLWLD